MELKSKTVIRFLVGTFLLSYLSWGLNVIGNRTWMFSFDAPVGMLFYILGGFSPTIISCIVLIRMHEVTGFSQILKDTFRLRQKLAIYVTIAGFTGLTYIVHIITGNLTYERPFYYVVLFLPLMIFGGGLEEVGWRYLLQPALEKKFSFLVSTAIVGVIWAFWHLPLFFIQGTSQNHDMTFPLFAIDVFGTAFVLGLLRRIGKGIWPCVLFHALNNAMTTSIAVEEKLLPTIITAGVLIIGALVYNYFEQGKNSDKRIEQRAA